MINLIPPQGVTMMKREYVLRVGASFCFFLSFIFLVFTAALAPSYILTSAQIKNFVAQVSENGNKVEIVKNAEQEIKVTNNMLAQLKSEKKSPQTNVLIGEIERRAPSGVTFKSFYVNETNGVIAGVQVQGIAVSREALIGLKNALEQSALFQKAEVPIADLAKDTNLPFMITITLRTNP